VFHNGSLVCLFVDEERCCLLIRYILFKRCVFVLEQPVSSLLSLHPRFQQLLRDYEALSLQSRVLGWCMRSCESPEMWNRSGRC
jgi:hypothetical protein